MSKLILFAELLANDEGDGLTIDTVGYYNTTTGEVIDGGTELGGTVVLTNDGVVYTPPKLSTKSEVVDSFYYRVTDVYGQISTANVTMTLSSVVVAKNDYVSVAIPCGTNLTMTKEQIMGNDEGGPALRITSVDDPVNGTAVLNSDGTVTFSTLPCNELSIDRGFVVPLRFTQSALDENGNAITPGLYANPEIISTLKPGDYAILSAIRMGSSPIEPGWTLLADSAQARLFYRVLDQAYIDRHNAPPYMGANAQPYPYFTSLAGDRMALPAIRVKTYAIPPYIDPADVILHSYANTHLSTELWSFNPPGFGEDFYRNVVIDAVGPAGLNGGDTNTPNALIYTTRVSNEDNLNNRKAEYIGNRYVLDTDGDTLGYWYAGGSVNAFSEYGSIQNISGVFATIYALRVVPRPNVTLEAGFNYTVADAGGSSDTAKVIAQAKPAINKLVTRLRQTNMFLNEQGFVGMDFIQPGNIEMGVHVKQYEDWSWIDPTFPSSYDNPLDPLPDQGWNIVTKTPPHREVAGTMVQRVATKQSGNNEINAFRNTAGLIASASMTGVELFVDPGETWADIFVSSQAWSQTIPTAQAPYIVPTVTIPEGCQCLYFNTVRPYTAKITVSGGDAFIYNSTRRDFVNYMSFVTHVTTGVPRISIMPGNTRETIDVSTFALVLKNRKK